MMADCECGMRCERCVEWANFETICSQVVSGYECANYETEKEELSGKIMEAKESEWLICAIMGYFEC